MTIRDERDESFTILTTNCIIGNHALCNGKQITQAGDKDCTCACHYPNGNIPD